MKSRILVRDERYDQYNASNGRLNRQSTESVVVSTAETDRSRAETTDWPPAARRRLTVAAVSETTSA
ncbi:hypothetical protein CP556_03005 [Natrinema sp. CBA1119]|uniref:hypothetical protein n=1 Tax=Natrinema sp. CBA1119 TaxID=1608465 RepID=UPI000BF3FCBB|nr:hypothetical protein [Natrinema sp. CBA1119]PGF15192.1 hypothetical protein CP556_03005 [Natrinema sp. CBA1119]